MPVSSEQPLANSIVIGEIENDKSVAKEEVWCNRKDAKEAGCCVGLGAIISKRLHSHRD